MLSISNAHPGDRIVVSNGLYITTESIQIKCTGTASLPITIEAETTGLRFSGDDHLIYKNYFQGCLKAIVCTNGDGEVKEGSKLTCHDRSDRVKMVYNLIIDCKSSYQMPGRNNGLGASNITFTYNIIQGGEPVSIQGEYPDAVWKGNILWNTSGGSIPTDGYVISNPGLVPDKHGVYHMPESNIKSMDNKYPAIPATNRPLTISDVGPNAVSSSSLPVPARIDIASPDGTIRCFVFTEKDQLALSVTLDGKPVIEKSPLRMSVDGVSITDGIKIGKVKKSSLNESYPWYGLHSTAANNFKSVIITLKNKAIKTEFNLEVRVFNDAVAFRFIVPGRENSLRKPDESTVFKLPAQSTVWYHDLYMHYEGTHAKKIVDTIPAGQWAAPPLTVKLARDAGYAAITEARLTGYAGMALQSDGENGFTIRLGHAHPASYPYVLRYTKEDVERLSKIAEVKGTITTSWRAIMVGKDLNTLVNCDVLHNLCPAPDKSLFPGGIKTGWIRPGRAVWRYLDGGGETTLKNMKEFSRMASDLGFEYNILEGFWSRWPDDSVRALVDYSKKLGVGIFVWKHSKDLRDPQKRTEFFQRLHNLGIAGIKIDFFDHEAREVIDLYESIFNEAAALKLSLILHGANKPTGLERTWPNIMIYEGVRGMESSKLMDRATHETTIPFTRMLAGPGDYSVCHFGDRRRNTTWVHQVSTAAIYAAPVITYAATPAHIIENPCVEMIKSIPPVWDETIVLPPSEIGELAIYAQRKGTTWFISVINGLQPRTVKIPLSFLGSGNYQALVLNDNPANPADAVVTHGTAIQNDVISIELGVGGGFMTRFTLK
ncbi:MAG: glycoside hydrolase family 97 N-terminal domain-containing protein [Bacteroidales bacterium]|nr:glycoside hydrolase family 97 N-terminal domain-containing protein [Bacteroidales bacterium]